MFHLDLEVLAPANFVTCRLGSCLRRGGEAAEVKRSFWFNTIRTNVAGMDGLKKSFQRRVWNTQGAAGFDCSQATVIDPVVDDLTGDLETRGDIIGSEVIGTHNCSLVLRYNRYGFFFIKEGTIVKDRL